MKKFKIISFFVIFFLFGPKVNLFVKESKAETYNNSSLSSSKILPMYHLGPGDRLLIRVFGYDEFNSEVIVLPDGTINVNRIGTINVNDLTLKDAKNKLSNSYSKILRNPIIYLDLLKTRPIRVAITGEVNRPGIYSIDIQGENQLVNNDGGEQTSIKTYGWPTLVDAIQKAGGITKKGDLKNVNLIRGNKKNSQIQITKVNYWDTLKNGKPIENHYIYDGDSVRIDPIKIRENNELFTIASSSFSPDSITINVVGEVNNPGLQTIKTNSPLSQAILSAGGITNKSNKNKIALIRMNPNGTITKSITSYSISNKADLLNNPTLIDGDVIVVEKNAWAKSSATIKTIVEPFSELIAPVTIYRVFSD